MSVDLPEECEPRKRQRSGMYSSATTKRGNGMGRDEEEAERLEEDEDGFERGGCGSSKLELQTPMMRFCRKETEDFEQSKL